MDLHITTALKVPSFIMAIPSRTSLICKVFCVLLGLVPVEPAPLVLGPAAGWLSADWGGKVEFSTRFVFPFLLMQTYYYLARA